MRIIAANFFVFASFLFARGDEGAEPMVGFHCNQPAMYQTDNGWIKDDSTGCLKDPPDILNYCRKVFPTLDVRNVVEASEKVTVPNWCDFGHTVCNQQFTVVPFRCLVGPFQSDALLVPEHCIFDHIHDSKICSSYFEWNQTSFRSCHDRDMVQQSFAMLQPCGIDKFNGVEFVCCPADEAVKKPEKTDTKPSTAVPTSSSSSSSSEPSTEKPKTVKNDDDFTEYVNQPVVGRKWNEHEYYVKAKNDMRKHHHEKVAKMMKDWSSARQRVQDLKSIDLKASEKLNKEITGRFQKTYEAEEVESEMEKKQLAMLHQQRVQSELNDKKRHTLDNYVQTIEDYDSDSTEILKALKHYVKALQKDRLHTVNHYKHLLETDPAEADADRSQMADHLRGIDRQLSQALDLLDRVPRFRNKVKKQMADFLDSYHSIDVSVSALLLYPEPSTTRPAARDASKKKVEEDLNDEYETDGKDEDETVPELEEVTKRPEEDDYEDYDEEIEEEEDDDEADADAEDISSQRPNTVSPSSSTVTPVTKTSTASSVEVDNEDEDDEEEEDDDDVSEQIHVKHEEHVANMEKSYLQLNEPYIKKSPLKGMSSFNAAIPLGIAVGGITVFVVIIVGVIVMRRRARQRRPRALGSLDLDPAASPEERHVASMQMNGYENPTYKYFEMGSSA